MALTTILEPTVLEKRLDTEELANEDGDAMVVFAAIARRRNPVLFTLEEGEGGVSSDN